MSLPDLPHHPVWTQFRIDPRQAPQMRLADRDRDVAREVLASGYADGQLNHEEYLQRLDQASVASTFGELMPLVGDLTMVSSGPPTRSSEPVFAEPQATGRRRGLDVAVDVVAMVGAGVVGINVAIWALVALNLGSNWVHLYFWPVWVALAMAIPVAVLLMVRGATDTEQDQVNREHHRARRRSLRARRRQRRRELGRR
ncbi:DUF1707 SHOCT-like domain-containing protein [Aestuariimicrobium sp. T2.26MG-19.2B]|uniref:DUF1707 SHOCT-like domain-containing protein n=1 Tax=Aestuariimicrobium sp. T2.26MG-19.2B TaxID=3040679 RepID=UPI0025410B46|nr:DUF1707 domain-containing protein [Aestuariimicrobium sp. T2.26MG-19.2B]